MRLGCHTEDRINGEGISRDVIDGTSVSKTAKISN